MNNNFRRMLCVVTAMLLAAFALPSIAAPQFTKSMNVIVSADQTIPVPVPVTVTLKLTNSSPAGNSNIGLWTATAPQGVTIVGFEPLAGATITLDSTNTTISVSFAGSPIKPKQSATLTIHVSGCGDALGWSTGVFTGQGGQTFADDGTSQLTTNIACQAVTCGIPFTVNGNAPPNDPTRVDGTYGSLNQVGICDAGTQNVANLYLTNAVLTQEQVHFRLAGAVAPASSWTFNTGALTSTPNVQVAWLTDTFGVPVFINAPLCASWRASAPALPEVLGVLSANVGSTGTSLPASSNFSPSTYQVPFYAKIGNTPPGEVVLVTKVTGSSWTVTRKAEWGATTHKAGANLVSYAPGVLAQSIGIYPAGPAKMCLANLQQSVLDTSRYSVTIFDFDDLGHGYGGIQ